ncbi:MAG: protoporphyrinogen oxidase [Chloroflexi bacterium]|nr:protoporphyrinogen oxidase [Chloroflexota bacterium]
MKRVVIIGGGITGLATAHALRERGRGVVDYTLIERAPRVGGKIVSTREDGFVIEGGPDSFLTTKPAALELCRALGLGARLIGTNDPARRVFVLNRGRLRPMPDGVMLIIPTRVMPFVKSSLISPLGKLRMGMELFIPPRRGEGDESLADFVRRRLGAEALDRIAEPMIAGIHMADAEYLSLQSTFPRFLDMEKKHGGLLRAIIAQRRASARARPTTPATPMFMSLRGGMQELVDTLVARLDERTLVTNQSAVHLARNGNYQITLRDGETLHADAIVLATPAYETANLVSNFDPDLATGLRAIRYVSTATVSLGFKRAELTHPLDGFGFVVPRSEKRKLIACSWSSTKFDHRAHAEYALVRVFIGGAHAEQFAEQDDATLTEIARAELAATMGIAAQPVVTRVYRWQKSNPQYAVGHQRRVEQIEQQAARHPGLYLVGSAYRGVGVPDCIQDGIRAAEQILTAFAA